MGASMDTPARDPFVCSLCHGVCRNPTALRCKHCFCYGCIKELWSCSKTGPYFCPECREEYKKLPIGFETAKNRGRDEAPTHSRTAANTGWAGVSSAVNPFGGNLGTRSSPSITSLSKRILGKRPTSSPVPGGHRHDNKRAATATGVLSEGQADDSERPISSCSSANQKTSSDVGFSSDEETRAPLATDWSSASTSTPRGLEPTGVIDLDSPPAARAPMTGDPLTGNPLTGDPLGEPKKWPEPTENMRKSSARATSIQGEPLPSPVRDSRSPARTRAESSPTDLPDVRSPTPTEGESTDRSEREAPSRSAGQLSPPTSPSRATGRANRFPSLGGHTSWESPVPCHYCPSHVSLPAVKTCLVCGASMCVDHLRHHLESPVFRTHTLVQPVDDLSPWRCPEHQEMNRIFCRQCSACVCTVCTVIGSHRGHVCVSIREAEEELRGRLKEDLRNMQGTEQSLQSRVTELTGKKQSCQVLLGDARAGVQQQYRVMRESLEQEEATALQCVSQEEARAVGGLEEQLSQLKESLTFLQHGLHALEELADAQGATRVQEQAFIMEYGKISKSVSERCSVKELEAPEEVDEARLRFLRRWTERRLESVVISLPERDPFRLLYGAIPCLDPDTAHPKLLLSEENRKVAYSEIPQACPEQATRFSSFPQVLASKPLQRGRTYWEVQVLADDGKWKVGVCEGQIGRKGQKDTCRMGYNPYSWCLLSERGVIEALHDKVSVVVEVDELERVGVLLDSEEGSLSFYKVAPGGALSLLHCFKLEFSEPIYPALAVSKTQLTITDLFQTHSAP